MIETLLYTQLIQTVNQKETHRSGFHYFW